MHQTAKNLASLPMQAHSLPITIPDQLSGKGRLKDNAVESGTFIPPHQLSLHSGQSVPLSSSSRLRTRNKLLQSTGFLPSGCTHTEGFEPPAVTRTLSDVRLRSAPAESELVESHSEPLAPITHAALSNNSNQFVRLGSKVSIPASIRELLD